MAPKAHHVGTVPPIEREAWQQPDDSKGGFERDWEHIDSQPCIDGSAGDAKSPSELASLMQGMHLADCSKSPWWQREDLGSDLDWVFNFPDTARAKGISAANAGGKGKGKSAKGKNKHKGKASSCGGKGKGEDPIYDAIDDNPFVGA